MRQKSEGRRDEAGRTVKDIRRKTRKRDPVFFQLQTDVAFDAWHCSRPDPHHLSRQWCMTGQNLVLTQSVQTFHQVLTGNSQRFRGSRDSVCETKPKEKELSDSLTLYSIPYTNFSSAIAGSAIKGGKTQCPKKKICWLRRLMRPED